MKFSVYLSRRDGKTITLAADEYIDIDVKAGARYIARLTLRDGETGPTIYNENDDDISTATGT